MTEKSTGSGQDGGSHVSGKVNWAEFDAATPADHQKHLISPEEHLQVAMARQ